MRRRRDLPPVAAQPWSTLIPDDSFYARLATARDVLVDDEPYVSLYKDSPKGRPSIPPSLVVLTMLLQYHDDCSDAEAEQRLRFDLRWKHALGLDLQDGGFDATVLCRFRRKLLDAGLERDLFNRVVRGAREAGLLRREATQVVDSSHILGAAGVRDTYTLLRGGIRKLLRALGYSVAQPRGLDERLLAYLDPDQPAKPDIEWEEAAARAAYLRAVVSDARAAVALTTAPSTVAAVSAAVAEAALLRKIVADDVEERPEAGFPTSPAPDAPTSGPAAATAPGETGQPVQLRQGVAADRILSVVDPELRWGHKSTSQRWAGYKLQLDQALESELITAVAVRSANEHDAVAAAVLIAGQDAAVGLRPGALLGDGAFGTGDARAELAALDVEVVARLPPLRNGGRFSKEAFTIDLAANAGAGSVTCPAGQTTGDHSWRRDERGRPIRIFHFPAGVCAACPLRAQCLGTRLPVATVRPRRSSGRTITLHFHEAVLQEARAAQRTPEQRHALRDRLRPRAKVERKFAELMRRHGLRQARYIGTAKTELQAVLTATMVNIKRISTLVATDQGLQARLQQAVVALPIVSLFLLRSISRPRRSQYYTRPHTRRSYLVPIPIKSAVS